MNLEAVRLILKYKPDVNYQCEDTGYTALHAASKSDNPDITKCLLDHGASTKIKSKKLVTPLHVALINGKKEVALELIKAEPSVVNEYTSELTRVSLATVANFPDVIETLAKYGADVNAAKSKLIPLQFALFRQLRSAPRSTSSFITSTLPPCAAECTIVSPDLLAALISAPLSRRIFTVVR